MSYLSQYDIERIARNAALSAVDQKEMERYFYSFITHNDFESRVRRMIQDELKHRIPIEVANYLASHLESRVKSELLSALPNLITPMVHAKVIEKLASLTGVENILTEHKQQIQSLLNDNYAEFLNQRNTQQTELTEARKKHSKIFNDAAEETAANIVKRLVSDPNSAEGQILRGFKEDLKRANQANFESFTRTTTANYQSNINTLTWIIGGLSVGLFGCAAYIAYLHTRI